MKKHGERIKHPKLRGEWAELCFTMRAAEEGLSISKPWGEVAHYDFVVEASGRFLRVQVKSTMFVDRGGYSCSVRGASGPYVGDAFDFLAVYLIPEDLWYIVPGALVRGQGSIALYPRLKRSKYARYREAWELLRGEKIDSIHACAEETVVIPFSSGIVGGWPICRAAGFRIRVCLQAYRKCCRISRAFRRWHTDSYLLREDYFPLLRPLDFRVLFAITAYYLSTMRRPRWAISSV